MIKDQAIVKQVLNWFFHVILSTCTQCTSTTNENWFMSFVSATILARYYFVCNFWLALRSGHQSCYVHCILKQMSE